MKGKIMFGSIITLAYGFFVYDGFCRFPKDKFFLGIYLLFYTFVYVYVMAYIISVKKE